jgi:hypothetical protein
MEPLNRGILRHLRGMARDEEAPSRMLRAIIAMLAPEQPHPLLLIRYMREAFGLSLGQTKPIAGWAPDGSAELDDARLDALLRPEVTKSRPEWESEDNTALA